MNVDLEIYLNNFIKFFKTNPKDLLNLVPKEMEQDFYKKIRERASLNLEEGLNVVLTQKQIIEICVELNRKNKPEEILDERVFKSTPFGVICLN
jgi:hypothetical protein